MVNSARKIALLADIVYRSAMRAGTFGVEASDSLRSAQITLLGLHSQAGMVVQAVLTYESILSSSPNSDSQWHSILNHVVALKELWLLDRAIQDAIAHSAPFPNSYVMITWRWLNLHSTDTATETTVTAAEQHLRELSEQMLQYLDRFEPTVRADAYSRLSKGLFMLIPSRPNHSGNAMAMPDSTKYTPSVVTKLATIIFKSISSQWTAKRVEIVVIELCRIGSPEKAKALMEQA